jgi:hypothetical protein
MPHVSLARVSDSYEALKYYFGYSSSSTKSAICASVGKINRHFVFPSGKISIGYFLFVVSCAQMFYFYCAFESPRIRYVFLPNHEHDHV